MNKRNNSRPAERKPAALASGAATGVQPRGGQIFRTKTFSGIRNNSKEKGPKLKKKSTELKKKEQNSRKRNNTREKRNKTQE